MNKTIVNGLWIGGTLSPLEILTIKSFQANGYKFQLWHYDELTNVPADTILKNAEEIVPKESVFSYNKVNKFGHGKGSFAGFSDIFRYKLLYEYGGIWVDMDVTCIQPITLESDYIFRYHHKSGVVGNFLKCPPKSELMNWCYHQAIKTMNADNEDWMLPIRILNEGIEKHHLEQFIYKFSNEDSFPMVSKLLIKKNSIPKDWKIIHWMNEEFRRLNINKFETANNSWLHYFMQQNSIDISVLSGRDKFRYGLKLSRLHYIYISIIARLKYFLQ